MPIVCSNQARKFTSIIYSPGNIYISERCYHPHVTDEKKQLELKEDQ